MKAPYKCYFLHERDNDKEGNDGSQSIASPLASYKNKLVSKG